MNAKVYPKVHGRARLETIPAGEFLPEGEYLWIGGTCYRLLRQERSFRLTKGDGTSFNVSLANRDQPRCDCPDATYRDREDGRCKHLAALEAVGLIRGQTCSTSD